MKLMRTLVNHPDAGLLLLRAMIAAVGVFHGGQKLFGLFGGPGITGFAEFLKSLNVPAPVPSAVAAGSAEFFGGLLIGLGLFTRLAAAPFAFTMAVAIATVHSNAFDGQHGGMEYPLTLAAIAVALIFMGPGRLSIDHAMFANKRGDR